MTDYRFKKWFDFGMILTVFITMFAISTMAVTTRTNSAEWDGRGTDSMKCEYLGQEERTKEGWIHWIFNQAGDVSDPLLILSGSGTGEYLPFKLSGPTYHFYTPYFDLDTLEAIMWFNGDYDGQFVISDYCPGVEVEELTVTKTVDTSFNRMHDWSLDKSVVKDTFYLYVDGSGDAKATWKVDVTYLGFVDADHNVKGEITIENTGNTDAMITKIEDVLGGTLIMVHCGVTFPYELIEGATLKCTYDEAGKFMGDNVVTVTTEKDEYSDTVAIVWGAPVNDVHATVVVKDASDLFGTVTLGTLNAYDYDKDDIIAFEYYKDFKWADYGKDNCGTHEYSNTATLYGDDRVILGYDTADITVYVQCFVYETAFAKGSTSQCFLDYGFSRWGWTNPITVGTYTMPVYAGAGQCTGGTYVGTVRVSYLGDYVAFKFQLDPMFDLNGTSVYAGYTRFPQVKIGKKTMSTVAPGQYYVTYPLEGGIFVIAHAVVGLPDPSFGP